MAVDFATLTKEISGVFDRCEKVKVPEPPISFKDRLAALSEAKLSLHRTACIFDMRRWQAAQLGFKEILVSEMVNMLMGAPHTEWSSGPERQHYEWAYDHHTNALLGNDWGGLPTVYKRVTRKGLWYLPPFAKTTEWECIFGKLNYLKRELPYGVILRINEVKSLNLFNAFHVLAPKEAWIAKTDVDPIVVGSIWELPPQLDPKKAQEAGTTAHFFLAQW